MPAAISVSRDIAAPPAAVMALVTDVTRSGEWSPETTSCSWAAGFDGPTLGARFSGSNRNGFHRWTTSCQVIAAEPLRFAFRVTYLGQQVADWDYAATETEGGCTLTETWTDRRGALFAKLSAIGSGVRDRETHNRAGMEATLAALAAAAERTG